jgi:FkbM family methyltransferase
VILFLSNDRRKDEMPDYTKWFGDDAEHLRYEYDLKPNSIVLDVGTYKGEFAQKIAKKYNCFVIGFEPIGTYFCEAVQNLREFNKVKIYNYGLGSRSRQERISLEKDSSSIYKRYHLSQAIMIHSFSEIINQLSLVSIELIKINIEGCEYELLETMIENNMQRLFKNIQVQFHDFVPGCYDKRNSIIDSLLETHEPTYCYPFVWENYRLVK